MRRSAGRWKNIYTHAWDKYTLRDYIKSGLYQNRATLSNNFDAVLPDKQFAIMATKAIKDFEYSNKRIIITKPDTSLFSYIDENILTTFKIKENQYFCYYDDNKEKMEYAKIEKGEAKDFEFKDFRIYFLKKKTERVKSKKK